MVLISRSYQHYTTLWIITVATTHSRNINKVAYVASL